MELAALERPQLGDFLSQMKRGVERLRLLQQPIDQFLCPADGQCRDIVDRFVRIQLGALAAGLRQRVDDVRADSEQAQFEDLKQPHGACADDDGLDRRGRRLGAHGFFRHDRPGSLNFRSKYGRKL